MDIWAKVRELALIPGEHEVREEDFEGLFNIGDIQRGRTSSGNYTYPISGVVFEGYVYPRGWIGWKFGSHESDPDYVSIRVLRKGKGESATFGYEHRGTPTPEAAMIGGGRGGTGRGYL